jgi:hypothetical protein
MGPQGLSSRMGPRVLNFYGCCTGPMSGVRTGLANP